MGKNKFQNNTKCFFKRTMLLTSLLVTSATVFFGCGTTSPVRETVTAQDFRYSPTTDALDFTELWGYVMVGREKEFSPQMPLSDVGYFWNAVNTLSEIIPPPDRSKFFADFTGRVHLVSSCESIGQTHLLLDPKLPLRDKIIAQLINAAKSYDGLQINWENIPAKDANNFHEFLREIKKRLGDKPLSVAVKARVRTLKDDVFSYEKIAAIADKLIIMAYDEHWNTSAPGPVASNEWGKKIADYALSQIPQEKLVMGVSLYGRTWTDDKIGGRAWYNSSIERVIAENNIKIERTGNIPHFTHNHTVKITGWYDDVDSVTIRCKMYAEQGISNLAFWRVGFENIHFWQNITLESILEAPKGDAEENKIEYAE